MFRIVLSLLLGVTSTTVLAETVVTAREAPLRTTGGPLDGGAWNLWSNGRVGQYLRFARTGTYQVVIRAAGSPAEGAWPEMALLVDGRAVATATVSRGKMADYRLQADLTAGDHEIAAAFLNDRLTADEDRNLYLDRITVIPPPGAADPTLVPQEEWTKDCRRREQSVLDRCRDQIEKNRKSTATVRVLDAAGKPLPGVAVQVEQTSHDFLFGCNIYMFDHFPQPSQNIAYQNRFEELFNYATTGFYWRSYEPRRGEPDYQYTNKVVAWCRQRGIRLKGHPLLWGNPAGIPAWSDGLPPSDLQRQRVLEIIGHYRGKIDFWEVVNEPTWHQRPGIDEPYRWARRADPSACQIVNDCYVLADGRPQFFKLLEDARRRGVPFDAVGIQAHEPVDMWFPLDRVWAILDQYATLGKELHITEFTPTSGGEKIIGSYRRGVWDEATQAEYAEKFYRVCFAHPAVRAITWWDLCDRGAWRSGGGLLHDDLTPKPVYRRLKRLIHQQWRTDAEGRTNAVGRFEFRGFHGEYRIVVQDRGGRIERRFHLSKTGPNLWNVKL